MTNFFVHMAFSVLLAVIRETAQLEPLKKAMLKLYREIKKAYADDPDFNE